MPWLVIAAIVALSLMSVILLKIVFGVAGVVLANALWIALGALIGYHYGKKSHQ